MLRGSWEEGAHSCVYWESQHMGGCGQRPHLYCRHSAALGHRAGQGGDGCQTLCFPSPSGLAPADPCGWQCFVALCILSWATAPTSFSGATEFSSYSSSSQDLRRAVVLLMEFGINKGSYRSLGLTRNKLGFIELNYCLSFWCNITESEDVTLERKGLKHWNILKRFYPCLLKPFPCWHW